MIFFSSFNIEATVSFPAEAVRICELFKHDPLQPIELVGKTETMRMFMFLNLKALGGYINHVGHTY